MLTGLVTFPLNARGSNDVHFAFPQSNVLIPDEMLAERIDNNGGFKKQIPTLPILEWIGAATVDKYDTSTANILKIFLSDGRTLTVTPNDHQGDLTLVEWAKNNLGLKDL